MDLARYDNNGCVLVATSIDAFGVVHEEHRREFRVTTASIRRMVRDLTTNAAPGTEVISAYGLVSRIDDFLGIEVIEATGAPHELGVLEFQHTLVDVLVQRSVSLVPDRLRSPKYPMTAASHGVFVAQLGGAEFADDRNSLAWASGVDGLTRSLDLLDQKSMLGMQWAKKKMVDARLAANLAFALTG